MAAESMSLMNSGASPDARALDAPAAIVDALEGEPLRQIAAQLADGDLTCFRLACAAFRAHSAPPAKRTRSAFLRSTAMAQFALERLPGFRAGRTPLLELAERVGEVDVLAWLHAAGCGWPALGHAFSDGGVAQAAAKHGHLKALRWLIEHDCPWDERTCYAAAREGHLEVLRWAREHGCPWDGRTCSWAAQFGHLEVLRWAHERGCPCPDHLVGRL